VRRVIDRECTSANSAIHSAIAQIFSNTKSFKYSSIPHARVARCRRCQQRDIDAAHRAIALQRTFVERILPFDFLLFEERSVKAQAFVILKIHPHRKRSRRG
jgi:hypothetical protein